MEVGIAVVREFVVMPHTDCNRGISIHTSQLYVLHVSHDACRFSRSIKTTHIDISIYIYVYIFIETTPNLRVAHDERAKEVGGSEALE